MFGFLFFWHNNFNDTMTRKLFYFKSRSEMLKFCMDVLLTVGTLLHKKIILI